MLRNILLIAAVLLVGSCKSPGGNGPIIPATLSFTRYQPIYLDVAKIEIVDEYKSPQRPPYVEHLLPYSPDDAMQIWIKDRLRAVGDDKTLEIIIRDASVVSTKLKTGSGITGFLTIAQDKRYDAKLDVEMRIYGGSAMSDASIGVNVTRSTTIAEDASVSQRDETFRRTIFDLMENFNAETEKNMFTYFGNYISFSHSP